MDLRLNTNHTIHLVEKYGTPLFIYDTEVFKKQFNNLKNHFPTNATIFYACKALSNLNILIYFQQLGTNIDCSSIQEVELALKAGFNPEKILYTSNSVHFEEIVAATKKNVHVTIDSLSNLEKFAKKFQSSKSVGIRLRPNILDGGNLKISTGHNTSKFGIPIEQMNMVYALCKKYKLQIETLHIHTGSEIKDLKSYKKIATIFEELIPHFPHLKYLDFGGGFKVPYKENEIGIDIPSLANFIKNFSKKINKKYQKSFQFWFEPGKYLVSAAGILLSKVNVIKNNPEQIILGLDTGLNHLIRPMYYGAYHKIENLSNRKGKNIEYTIVGNICETDTFAEKRKLRITKEDDILVFYNAGAYCYEMSMNYNSRFKPPQILLIDNKDYLISKRSNLNSLINNQIKIF